MSFFADLIELLLPDRCAGCGAAPVLLCERCGAPLLAPARPARTAPDGLPPPWAVAAYEGPLRAILSAYKEHGRTALAVPLGEALATAIRAALNPAPFTPSPKAGLATTRPTTATLPTPTEGARTARASDRRPARAVRAPDQPVAVVWVPSARGAVRRRGHDPLRGAVAVAVRRLRAEGLPVTAVPALRQRGRVADQAGLTATQRIANLKGALEVTPATDLTGHRIVLVDDVMTTGASLAEAARALRNAGADPSAAATIATTPRRHRQR
ncbi:ComF family protein [Actinomadura chibensis]|uniref:ComF family protein n=1 Tax=Actinomadura chibensis TaxID=392828 RepID=A0A5D0NUW3_9ACTN|nr:phosphoribosyltransferase family protein [Actinomadura chibensis]TYB48296.1 ComF family protein [Actinomadura chibensis]